MPDSVLNTPPQMPDFAAAAEAMGELARAAQGATMAGMKSFGRPQGPLPYDPTPIARAYAAFGASLLSEPLRVAEAQRKAWGEWAELWNTAAKRALGQDVAPVIQPVKGDRRFYAPAWSNEPVFDTVKQAYLLASRQIGELIEGFETLPDADKVQVEFYTRQLLNALSPSNFPATNPEVLKKTLESGGVNLLRGATHLLEDVSRGDGLVERRTPDGFELGVTIAATPGSVVFRNDLMELIQYNPSTETVYRRPLLFVPPTVNKYYLFDLTPKSSFIKWLVDQGHTVFVVSWVNPDDAHRHKSLSDYVKEGPLAALDAIEQATGEREIDLVAYCLGGTLSALALGYLTATGEGDRVGSATLIATLLDFTDLGDWSVFIDENHLSAFKRYLDHKGYVEAHDLAKLFSLVRANDLIWSNVVTHYLMGEEAAPSDMLWWFADAARMPAAMLSDYGQLVLQGNRLKLPGGIEVDGVPLDLAQVKTPITLVSLRDDHVSGWEATYAGAKLFGGEVRFVLGGSGHNAGTVNHPAANKHGFWTNPAAKLAETPEAWLAGAAKQDGSWWPQWQGWLDQRAGKKRVPARQVGAGELPALEAAPGSYVRVRH